MKKIILLLLLIICTGLVFANSTIPNAVQSLNISNNIGNVSIIYSNKQISPTVSTVVKQYQNAKGLVKVNSNAYPLAISVSGGDVTIIPGSVNPKYLSSGSSDIASMSTPQFSEDITITLPENTALNVLTIKNSVGNVVLDSPNVNLKYVNIVNGIGDVNLKEFIYPTAFDIVTGVGNVFFQGDTSMLQAKTGYGKINLVKYNFISSVYTNVGNSDSAAKTIIVGKGNIQLEKMGFYLAISKECPPVQLYFNGKLYKTYVPNGKRDIIDSIYNYDEYKTFSIKLYENGKWDIEGAENAKVRKFNSISIDAKGDFSLNSSNE